jgi:predicted nucleic acid-binding protein
MNRAVLADTGPLYAAVDPDDQYHARAQAELIELAADGWQVLAILPTILEAYTLILHRLGIPTAHRWLDDLTGSATPLIPTAADATAAFALVRRYPDQDVTLFDALLAIVSTRLAATIWTYDAHFDILRADRWYATGTGRR